MAKFKKRPSDMGRKILRSYDMKQNVLSRGGFAQVTTGKINGGNMHIYENDVCLEIPSPRVSSFYVPRRKRVSNYLITGGPAYFIFKGYEDGFVTHIVGDIYGELSNRFDGQVTKNAVMNSIKRYMERRGYPEYMKLKFIEKIRETEIRGTNKGTAAA